MTTTPYRGGIPDGVPPPPPPEHAVPQPVPVPITVGVAVAHGPDADLVRLDVFGPCGQQVYFLPADTAEQVGEGIRRAARQARTGLVVAQGPLA